MEILTSGGGLAGVDMADDDDVDMSLFLTRVGRDMSAMIIDIKLKAFFHDRRRSAGRKEMLCLPHGDGLV